MLLFDASHPVSAVLVKEVVLYVWLFRLGAVRPAGAEQKYDTISCKIGSTARGVTGVVRKPRAQQRNAQESRVAPCEGCYRVRA